MIENACGCNCTGCSACVSACPVSAITLVPNKRGFSYPKVNEDLCIDCRKCIITCPSLSPLPEGLYYNPVVYAGWNTDDEIRLESTSGGVYSALAQAVISRGGYVVAAEYDADFCVCHTIIDASHDIARQRQSKYAQSDLGNVFTRVKALLDNGELVLFCGTPCQSAGLQKYLSREYDYLYCCDFICRGVISPKVYQKFLDDMRPTKTAVLQKVHFKNKDYGWNRFSTKLTFDEGTIYQRDRDRDYYMRGYLKHNLYLRDCCYQCDYKRFPRVSDISLGDFWGIGNYDPSLDNEQGTSVILVNSAKGNDLLMWAKEHLVLTERSLSEVLAGNSCLLEPVARGEYSDYFFDRMGKVEFRELIDSIDKKASNISVTERFHGVLSVLKHMLKGDMK